jgi:hypothetical protein
MAAWPCCFGPMGRQTTPHLAEGTPHLIAAENKKRQEGLGSVSPARAHPNDLNSSHQAPPSKGSTTSHNTTDW